ncbi:MAG: putative polymerase subfamily sigma factor [Acidimicrobiales bacterium]|nr:putative polymerase subfamily sigma factor [Acidimicrobiales bacterium]
MMPADPMSTELAADADAMWRRHGPAALRLATVLVGPDDAHDITVTGFLSAVGSAAWSESTDHRGYLLRAVSFAARDFRRQRARRWRRDLEAVAAVTTTAPETTIDLRRQVAELSLQQRNVIYLAYWEDMTEAAIAAMLDLSVGTVHRNLTRAKQRLRKALE